MTNWHNKSFEGVLINIEKKKVNSEKYKLALWYDTHDNDILFTIHFSFLILVESKFGAGNGNRTHISGSEALHSTIELYPHGLIIAYK